MSPVATSLRIDIEPETPGSGVRDVSYLHLTESSQLASPLMANEVKRQMLHLIHLYDKAPIPRVMMKGS